MFERMINGKRMYWCDQCKRYTLTHHSGTHKKKSELASNQSNQDSGSAQAHIAVDPSVWLCEITDQSVSKNEPNFNYQSFKLKRNKKYEVLRKN